VKRLNGGMTIVPVQRRSHDGASPWFLHQRGAGLDLEHRPGQVLASTTSHTSRSLEAVSRRAHTGAVDEDVQRVDGDRYAASATLTLCSMGAPLERIACAASGSNRVLDNRKGPRFAAGGRRVMPAFTCAWASRARCPVRSCHGGTRCGGHRAKSRRSGPRPA
jgi:hypothetical protein